MTKPAGMADATGDATGLLARAPIQVSTRRSNDGGSGILRDQQAAEGRRRLATLDRQLGFDEERRAVLVRRSTAMERPGVSDTPCAPSGSPSLVRSVMRKNTYERLAARTFAASSDLRSSNLGLPALRCPCARSCGGR